MTNLHQNFFILASSFLIQRSKNQILSKVHRVFTKSRALPKILSNSFRRFSFKSHFSSKASVYKDIIIQFISESRLNYEAKNPISYEAQNPICYEAAKNQNLYLKYEAQFPTQKSLINKILESTPLEKRKLAVLQDLESIFDDQLSIKKKVQVDLGWDSSLVMNTYSVSKTTEDSINNQMISTETVDFFSYGLPSNDNGTLIQSPTLALDLDKVDHINVKKSRPSAAKDFKGLICYGFGQILEKYLFVDSLSQYADSIIRFKYDFNNVDVVQSFKKNFLEYVQVNISGKSGANGKGKFKVSSMKDIENCFHTNAGDDENSKKLKEFALIMMDYFLTSKYFDEWIYCIYDTKFQENKAFFKNNRKEIVKAFTHPTQSCRFNY